MNIDRMINISLLKLSNKYQYNLIEMRTYKKSKKYTSIKLVIYKYDEKEENKKHYYKTLEFKSKRDLLLKLKEMI
jgi:hypothetical protein